MQQPMRHDESTASERRSSRTGRNRRRRRSRSSTADGRTGDPHDPHTTVPWQAMKRLRVDATQTMTTERADNLPVFEGDFAAWSSSGIDTDACMRLRTPPTNCDVANMTTVKPQHRQQPQEHQPSNSLYNNYDSYHCYQRHQHQETGQDTDGWSSPEQQHRAHPPYDRGHSLAPSVLLGSGDDDDDMDYQNVNHILGNLHIERQQRMTQQQHHHQQQYAPRRQYENSNNSYMNNSEQPMIDGNIHESSNNPFSNMNESSLLTTVPSTPTVRRPQLLDSGLLLQSQHQLSGYNVQYQTPPAKPTKRKVVQTVHQFETGMSGVCYRYLLQMNEHMSTQHNLLWQRF